MNDPSFICVHTDKPCEAEFLSCSCCPINPNEINNIHKSNEEKDDE